MLSDTPPPLLGNLYRSAARWIYFKTWIFILFFEKSFALLAKGPCILFAGKWYLTGSCPKKTPNVFLITKNPGIFLLSNGGKKKKGQ